MNNVREFSDSEIDMGSKEMKKLVRVLSLESQDADVLLHKESEKTEEGVGPGKETQLDYLERKEK